MWKLALLLSHQRIGRGPGNSMYRTLVLPPQQLTLAGQIGQLRPDACEQIGIPSDKRGNHRVLRLESAQRHRKRILIALQST